MVPALIRFDREVGYGVVGDARDMREVVVGAVEEVDARRDLAERAPEIVLKDVSNEELGLCREVGAKDIVHHARRRVGVGAPVEES